MKAVFIGIVLLVGHLEMAQAQHRVGGVGGYTLSRVQAFYPADHSSSFLDDDYTVFTFCHAAYAGLFYEYTPQKIRYHIGLNAVTMGAGNVPGAEPESNYPWYSYYLTLPLAISYPIALGKNVQLNPQVGLEPGLQWGNPYVILVGQGKYWGHLGLLAGVEVEYKQLRLGVRMQYGLTDFLTLPPYHYRHTALTTYIGYTFYDHAKAKARRLQRAQAKALDQQ